MLKPALRNAYSLRYIHRSTDSMSARSDAAADLGGLLTEDKPRSCEPIRHALTDPDFEFHERGEPPEDWLLRRLMGGVHSHVQEIVSR